MTKLLLFLLTVVFSASARSDEIKTSNENATVTFDIPGKSSTYLAFLAGEEDASFTFDVEGLVFTKQGAENSTTKSYQLFEAQRWHLMQIFIKNKMDVKLTVTIYPKTVYDMTGDLGQPRKIKIKSKENIYWTQCTDYHSCYFSGSVLNATDCRRDSPMSTTALVLIIVCGLLFVTVVGLVAVVLILIRGKKSAEHKEPEPNVIEEAIYEEVSLSGTLGNFHRGQGDHESINSLYGATTQRGG
ncbi:uncharacterized protein [Macrobrachium rosenbergii]|uniref:uncharacterized protein n=1 Tax=Macrobrachium rosenbergii TaxID=79674 RepID=UPI0034D4B87C